MCNIYHDEFANAQAMVLIAERAPKLAALKTKMRSDIPMHEKSLAFVEAYMLMSFDTHACKRLVLEFEIEALKVRNASEGL
jgi:hypothetical protein